MTAFRQRLIDGMAATRFRPTSHGRVMRLGATALALVVFACAAVATTGSWVATGLAIYAGWRVVDFLVFLTLVDDFNAEVECRRRRFGILP